MPPLDDFGANKLEFTLLVDALCLIARPFQPHLYSADANLVFFGQHADFLTSQVPLPQDSLVAPRQLIQRLFSMVPAIVQGSVVAPLNMVVFVQISITEKRVPTQVALLPNGKAVITSEGVKPGGKAGFLPETAQTSEHFDEHFLGLILRFGRILQVANTGLVYFAVVTAVKLGEIGRLPRLQESVYQLLVSKGVSHCQ